MILKSPSSVACGVCVSLTDPLDTSFMQGLSEFSSARVPPIHVDSKKFAIYVDCGWGHAFVQQLDDAGKTPEPKSSGCEEEAPCKLH